MIKKKYNCVILCGGYGSRLAQYTKKTPKPLLEVAGKPFLFYLINNLIRFGFKRILLLTHYKKELFFEFKKKYFKSFPIKIKNEKIKLGTGGSLVAARDNLDDDFFLLNGDTYFDINILDLKLHQKNKQLITAACTYKKIAKYSIQKYLSKSKIINLKKNKKNLVFGGIYFIKKKLLANYKVKALDLDKDIIFPLFEKKLVNIKTYKKESHPQLKHICIFSAQNPQQKKQKSFIFSYPTKFFSPLFFYFFINAKKHTKHKYDIKTNIPRQKGI